MHVLVVELIRSQFYFLLFLNSDFCTVDVAHVNVVAVGHSFRSQFYCMEDVLFTPPVGDSELR